MRVLHLTCHARAIQAHLHPGSRPCRNKGRMVTKEMNGHANERSAGVARAKKGSSSREYGGTAREGSKAGRKKGKQGRKETIDVHASGKMSEDNIAFLVDFQRGGAVFAGPLKIEDDELQNEIKE